MRKNRLVLTGASLLASAALAAPLTGVPNANPKIVGVSAPNVLSPELVETPVAQGSNRLENPSAEVSFYGYDNDFSSFAPLPGSVQMPNVKIEASKTEPDKNTYLVLHGQKGADPSYDYGRHFLFQGHETGTVGYITRINLDADDDHRITRMAQTDTTGATLPVFDGSTWNPFARRLLFSAEAGANGGIWQATLDFPSTVEPLHGSFGRGGYEGMQTDSDGNVWVVEDVGGTTSKNGRRPNSFVYRFVPRHKHDLTKGKMQVLQVISLRTGTPIVFDPAASADAAILSDDVKDLHTYGKVFRTRWITIHDTQTDGTASFDANALAKSFGGTPFKRPENAQFRPGSDFREFFFDETGDTNLDTQAGTTFGGFGALFRLHQQSPSADEGTLHLFYNGDPVHAAFDNVAFWDRNHVVFVEDAGDGLHRQRNALDSAWLFDVRVDYSNPANQPVRIIAQGRDASATLDSAYSDAGKGFQNEGDNEITGIHISDGDPTARGLLGAKIPSPFEDGWRVFYTQQHGDNVTWEILPAGGRRDRDDRHDD